ncbi:uncharacterized protein NEMAJ01_2021 [Nematocida major]|uniref:uncharacterized protein n=1 Tax=Nematocida major TaxID=1912982 RepID=UPI002008569C|nr:uncharacterized protein NEMAJ01_2021 [Nematocida major]KAH9387125.1 hypothetical protein NEMAJ01_2021 [Nematocida major]
MLQMGASRNAILKRQQTQSDFCIAFRAKACFLLLGCLICQAAARISVDDIMQLQTKEIKTGQKTALVHPDGPFNFLRGYIYAQQGYMYSKRVLAPEIDVRYDVCPVESGKPGAYKYTRAAAHDRPYAAKSASAAARYSEAYHKMLIQMFPSTGGRLAISVNRHDSMHCFLQEACSKEQAHYVLAALLLLAEGEAVPVKTSGLDILICPCKKQGAGKANPNAAEPAPSALCAVSRKAKKGRKPFKEILAVLEFFQTHQNAVPMPRTYEEFSSGRFLDSPQFLIQAYVFEYIEAKEDALQVAACAYKILEHMESSAETLARFFVGPEKRSEVLENTKLLAEMHARLAESSWFPFWDTNTNPNYTQVRAYSRSKCAFSDEQFSNCAEAGLYSLFCCLAYDPNKKQYDIDALLGDRKDCAEAQDLRNFFKRDNVQPGTCATKETFESWNRVVSGLLPGKVVYCLESGNELLSDVLNLLHVVACVSGRLPAHGYAIGALRIRLKRSTESTIEAVFSEAQKLAVDLLSGLSVNKRMKVVLENMQACVSSEGHCKAYGSILLQFWHKSQSQPQCLYLDVYKRHTSTEFLLPAPSFAEEEALRLSAAVAHYREQRSFICHLVSDYILACAFEGEDGADSSLVAKAARRAAEEMEKDASGSVNRVFLSRHMQHLADKVVFANGIYIHGHRLVQNSEHPLARLIANIFGSAPLADRQTQQAALSLVACTSGLKRGLAPKIQLSKDTCAEYHKNINTLGKLSFHLQAADAVLACEVILDHLQEYTAHGLPFENCHALLASSASTLCEWMFANNTVHFAQKIRALVQAGGSGEEKPRAAEFASSLWLFWFSHLAASSKEGCAELAAQMYDEIEPGDCEVLNGKKHGYLYDQFIVSEACALLRSDSPIRRALLQKGGEEKLESVCIILEKAYRG